MPIYVYAYIMKTIVLHTPKGGSGKSTLARELAVALDAIGETVAIADLDPQGTTRGWYGRRKAESPVVIGQDAISKAADAGVTFLIVDTPPGHMQSPKPSETPLIASLISSADLVLVPVRPTPDDLLGAAPIANTLAKLKPAKWAFVLSQVPPRSRFTFPAVRQLAALGMVAPEQIGFRADYPAASIDGTAAVEFSGKASKEVKQLVKYVIASVSDNNE